MIYIMSLKEKVENKLSHLWVRRPKYIQRGWEVATIVEFAMKDYKLQQDCSQCPVAKKTQG